MFDIFVIIAQNIDCGYTLEPPRRGSKEFPHLCFGAKITKIDIPYIPQFLLYTKVEFKGVYMPRTCYLDVIGNIKQKS